MKAFFGAFFGAFLGTVFAFGLLFVVLSFTAQAVGGYIKTHFKDDSSNGSMMRKMQALGNTMKKMADQAQSDGVAE